MLGSLMQYTCCDWDIIDQTIYSYNYLREITISTLKKLFWKCVIEDALINFWGLKMHQNAGFCASGKILGFPNISGQVPCVIF